MELAKKELLLEGLDCANCAMKIENEVKKINGVTSCTVNFATTMMQIETAAGDEGPVMEEAIKRVNKLEPHIKVKEFKKKVSRGSARARLEAAAAQGSTSTSSHGSHTHGEGAACCSHDHAEASPSHDHAGHNHNHSHGHEHEHEHGEEDDGHGLSHGNENTTRMIARLLASGAILAAGILAPVSGLAELAIFVAAYVIIGGDIVWRALRNIVRGRVFDENFLMAIATIGAFAPQQ